MRAWWRLGAWGCGAAIAVAAAIVVSHSDVGAQRLRDALAIFNAPVQAEPVLLTAAQAIPRNLDAESRTLKLSEAVRVLIADRDRLITRIASLERSLDDLPGASKAAPAPAPAQRNVDAESETRQLSEAVRVLTADRDRLLTRIVSLERNLGDMTGAIRVAPVPAQRSFDAESEMRRLAEAVRVLTADQDRLTARIASLDRNLGDLSGASKATPAPVQRFVESETAADERATTRVKFGVDLGAAASMEMLHAQWAVAKTNHARLFEGLYPVVGVGESKPGVPELRLIVGPLTDVAAAAKLCAALAAVRTSCRTAVFDGQRLAPNESVNGGGTAPAEKAAAAKAAADKAAADKLATEAAADKTAAVTASCPGNPNALGTSRVLAVSADELARLGTMQYERTLPLADHEVVLTFDDGPLPPYTNHVLAALAAECVKATYFMVGRMANAYPDAVRRVYNAGHTIGTHSQHHPYTFASMSPESAAREINDGFASVVAALGNAKAVAPFFRFPGLLRVKSVENYLASRSIMTWSADLDADDWHRNIAANEVLRRALSRLESRGRGMLLLHDIQPATALMLPTLLKELKKRGYRIVQVVPSGGERPQSVPVAASGQGKQEQQGWPRLAGKRTDNLIK